MKKLFVPLLLLYFSHAGAQNWLKDMYDPSVNFYTVQQEYNDWWAVNGPAILADTSRDDREHGEAWKIYKRWEYDIGPLMEANHGNRSGAYDPAEAAYYRQRSSRNNQRSGGTWTFIGNQSAFNDNLNNGDSCTGRVNCVRFDPNNRGTIFCGAPSGGLWKSRDFGHSWQLLNTDNLPQIGVSDIAINPYNSNTIYIATGDIAGAATNSIGVLKSTDGGLTWDTTGLSWTVSQGKLIARLLMDPTDTNKLIAAANSGVFKTIDGGATWTSSTSISGLTGMEFNPANPQTIYACNTQLNKSVDGGSTWLHLAAGLPNSTVSGGFAVGLTPADTSCVYILVSGAATGASYVSFNGIYQSLDGGNSFSLRSSNPDPSNTGTQGQYDLVLAVSPTDRNQLVMAAVENAWSADSGVTWTAPMVDSHVDHHDMRFYPGSGDTVFSADDGGLFVSADRGNSWSGLNDGMHIGQLYHVSSSAQTKYLYLTGRQDDGVLEQDTTFAKILLPGDGLGCLIDPRDNNHILAALQNGFVFGTTDGGTSATILASTFSTGINGPGAWNTPFALDPDSSHRVYIAKGQVYESNDDGNTWNTLNFPTLTPNVNYTLMAIAQSDNQYIYAGTSSKLYVSADGGNTYADITAGLHAPFYCIAVSPNNPQEVWVGTSNCQIFKSTAAGSSGSWANYSTGLPVGTPFHPQTLAAVRNSPDAVYAGLYYAGGVYYRDSTMSQWIPYSSGLPNVTVYDLEVDYCAGKIRAATYGRDVWETDPYLPIFLPPAAYASDSIAAASECSDTFQFIDHSAYTPTSWQWYFPGGQPASSTSPSPTVAYPDNGNYTATLIVSNTYGADTARYTVSTTPCLGIKNPTAASTVQIIPNPNNGNFVISLNNNVRGETDFNIYDNMGRSVYQLSALKNADLLTAEFSLSGLPAGVYFVHVTSSGSSSIEKLVVSN
jgi:photosystem II stability/assembly factor-like uncharacterized protein